MYVTKTFFVVSVGRAVLEDLSFLRVQEGREPESMCEGQGTRLTSGRWGVGGGTLWEGGRGERVEDKTFHYVWTPKSDFTSVCDVLFPTT